MRKVMRDFVVLNADGQWIQVEEAIWDFPDKTHPNALSMETNNKGTKITLRWYEPKLVSIKLKDKP